MATMTDKDDDKGAPPPSIEDQEKALLTPPEPEGDSKAAAPDVEDDEDDVRMTADADGAEDPDATEEQRERRRLERKQRAERRRLARARSERELADAKAQIAELNKRLAQVETGTTQSAIASTERELQSNISSAQNAFNEANAAIKKAMDENNSEALIKAMNVRDQARELFHQSTAQLQRVKSYRENPPERRQETRQTETADAPDPQMVAEYRKFQARNPWYDPNGRDADSQKAIAIDAALSAEGFDPTSSEYWDELETRLRRAAPHRYEDDGEPPVTKKPNAGSRRTPPVSGARGGRDGSGPPTSSFSKERLAALREAAGGDEKKFQRLVAYSKAVDKKSNSNASR